MSILRKLTLVTGLMLLIPLGFWIVDYRWSLNQMQGRSDNTVWIMLTQSGSTPYAYYVSVCLLVWILCITHRYLNWKVVLMICGLSLMGTQLAQISLKQLFAVPRPYVVEMQISGYLQHYDLKIESYYQLKKKQRAQIVRHRAVTADELEVAEYQAKELGYSFPSGHTIFAVSWLLVTMGLLSQICTLTAYVFQVTLILWSGTILYSRVRLGMHYPIDLLVSIIISWLWHRFLFMKIRVY